MRKGLERMLDKSCPKGLKPFEVERGHTRELPIPYIPVSDDMAEAVAKTSGALGYKLDLPSGIKVTHALWENRNAEAFLKHVMAAMSYVSKKGYIKEYEAPKRYAGRAVFKCKVRENLWIAAPEPEPGFASPELEAFQEARDKVRDKNLACTEVAGQMFVLYKNLLSKNARHKWTTIVDPQVNADMWTDLQGTVHMVARSPLYQSFEDCVKFHLLTVFHLDSAEQERYYINVHLKSLLVS